MFYPEPPANVCKKQIGEPCKIKLGSYLKDPEGLASTGAHFLVIAFPVSTARHIYGMCPECPIQTTVCGLCTQWITALFHKPFGSSVISKYSPSQQSPFP